jgi:hypothetical protein
MSLMLDLGVDLSGVNMRSVRNDGHANKGR